MTVSLYIGFGLGNPVRPNLSEISRRSLRDRVLTFATQRNFRKRRTLILPKLVFFQRTAQFHSDMDSPLQFVNAISSGLEITRNPLGFKARPQDQSSVMSSCLTLQLNLASGSV